MQEDVSPGRTPMDRLDLILETKVGLDGLYHQILSRAEDLDILPDILVAITTTGQDWSISSHAAHLGCKTFDVIAALVPLHAIVQVPKDDETPIALFHQSFCDFLYDEERSGWFSVHRIKRGLPTRQE